jgi:transcriptional regulator with XRE-family HTH domain
MISDRVPGHTETSPMSIPKELDRKCGQFFKEAREAMDISRSDVEEAGSVEFTEIVKFEIGSKPLREGLWKAYIQAIEQASDVSEFILVNASELLRGLVNEMRYQAA